MSANVQPMDMKVQPIDAKVQPMDTKVQTMDVKVQTIDVKVQTMDTKVPNYSDEKFTIGDLNLVVLYQVKWRSGLVSLLKFFGILNIFSLQVGLIGRIFHRLTPKMIIFKMKKILAFCERKQKNFPDPNPNNLKAFFCIKSKKRPLPRIDILIWNSIQGVMITVCAMGMLLRSEETFRSKNNLVGKFLEKELQILDSQSTTRYSDELKPMFPLIWEYAVVDTALMLGVSADVKSYILHILRYCENNSIFSI